MVEHIEQKVEQQSEYYGQTVAEVVILLEYKIIVPDICIIPRSSPKCHDARASKKWLLDDYYYCCWYLNIIIAINHILILHRILPMIMWHSTKSRQYRQKNVFRDFCNISFAFRERSQFCTSKSSRNNSMKDISLFKLDMTTLTLIHFHLIYW